MLRWLAPVVLLWLLAVGAHADTATGFAHRIHDLKLTTAGTESLPCGSCHPLAGGRLVGKPGHATCFTAACHAPKPTAGKVCEVCHAASALAQPRAKPPVFYPPYAIDRDFRVQLGHASHASAPCTTCHLPRPAAPHARCLGCHDGKATFAMATCEPCHAAASGDPKPPELGPTMYSMKSSFSHSKHATRGPAGAACATCHAALAKSNDQFLPRPTAATCAASGCHDGAGGFAITEACTRCHVDPATAVVRMPVVRYRHALHAKLPCATCHKVAGNEVTSTGHAACVGCHAAEFGSPGPRICLACHSSIEPWRHLVVDRLPPPASEFGADLAHGKHDRPCAECHSLDTATHELRPPRGHGACSGCHLATTGPAPHLDDCAACHTAGLQSARDITRRGAAWSVRQRFHHRTHTAPCTTCHVDMSAASIADLATPPKATCAGCHEGRTAFKLTGTTCTRCHVGL